MSINRSIRNAKGQTKDEESELDESLLQEGRLKNLLTTNKRKVIRPRDVFNNIQEDLPKLRKSIVDRALQTYISSTPMPTEARRDFFCTENSLNISPISSNSEEKSNDPQGHDKEQANKRNNEEQKLLNNEPDGSLNKTPIPILISDSSDENIVDTDGSKNKPESKHVTTKNNDNQTKSPYNTRSVDRNKSASNEVNQILDITIHRISCDSFKQANINKEQETPRDLKKPVSVASGDKRSNRKNTLSNRKRIDINVLPKKPISPNCSKQSRNGGKEQNELVSKQIESSTCGGRKAQNVLPKNHDLEPNISKKKILKKSSTSKNSIRKVSETENAKISTDEINKNKILTRNNTFNVGIDNINVTYSQQSPRVTRKKSERTSNEINCFNTVNGSSQRIALRNLTDENVVTKRVESQKGMSPRKLSFLYKDPETKNDIDVLDIKSSKTKKTDGDIKQPAENRSKIYVLRSGSKSKEICVDRITKPLQNYSVPTEPVMDNNYNSCNGNVEQIEKNVYPLECPPKRPHRKKKSQQNFFLLEQESNNKNKLTSNISQQVSIKPPDIRNKCTVVLENLNENDISLKQMENDFEKDLVQNDCSPNKLEAVHAKSLENTSSNNLKRKHIDVLSNILISEKRGEDTGHLLTKEYIPAKTYNEIGTSPIILENEIRSLNSENNLVAAESSERTLNIVAENKEDPNLEKSLVEIGTSPIKFTGENIDIDRKMVMSKNPLAEAVASPRNLESTVHRKTSEVRCSKTEKLNQILSKLSNGLLTPPGTSSSQINSNNGRFVNTNQSLHKEIQTSTKSPSDYSSPRKRIHREIQTSIKSVRKRTPYRKNFSRNIFTQTVLEQGTQTSSSLSRISKSCRKYKRMEAQEVNCNKSDSSNTDQSEILKEYERERDRDMLFQSLANVIIPPSFSSSDDDGFEDTLRNDNSQNLPWRLDEDLFPLQRKSSLKLNFIRSAREIEIEKNFTSNLNKSMISSDSDSELEEKKLEKEEYGPYERTSRLNYARRNKLQIYSRAPIRSNKKGTGKLTSDLKCTDDEKRSPSLQSHISDILPIESTYKTNQRYQEKQEIPHEDDKLPSLLVNEAPSHLPDNNIGENNCLDNQPTEEDLSQQGVNISAEASKDTPQSPAEKAISISNMHSLIVILENDAQLMIDKFKLNKGNSSCISISKKESIKGTYKSTTIHETRSKSTKRNYNKKQKVNKSDNEDEILATPLEDSDIPQLQLSDASDKPESTENLADSFKEISSSVNNDKTSDSGTSVSAKQVKKHIFKVPRSPKTNVRKSKKKLIPDDGVSSSIDSTQLTGIRRSGRERKPVHRRFSGIVATSNKREIDYYNGTLRTSVNVTSNVTVNKSSRPSTKKKQKESKNELVKKNGGRRRVRNQVHEKKQDNLAAVEEGEIKNTDEVDISQVPNKDDTPETDKVKKHHMTDDISSTTDNISNKEMYITPKRNKIANENKIHSPTIDLQNKNLVTNKTSKKDMVSSTSHFVPSETYQNTNVCVDNDHIFDNLTTNDNNNSINNYTNGETSQENINDFSTEPAIKHNDHNRFSTFNTNMLQDNNHTTEDNTQSKDSGTSTMLRSTTTEDSNFQTSKLLTGRISKKYKKKDYIHNKISKVLSRSINHSGEMELLIEKDRNMIDSVSMAQTSFTNPKDKEYINVLSNNDIISMKYVEKEPNFNLMNDLMVTDLLKNYKDGGAMGFLKLPPGTRKPLRIAKKFMLFYTVIDGEAFIQVHNKSTRVGKLGDFIIPLGTEYSINNVSKEDSLTLHFVKVPSAVGS